MKASSKNRHCGKDKIWKPNAAQSETIFYKEVARLPSASFRLLKIYMHITPSQRNVSTWKAASQWNNRTPSVHSIQTWASRESDSVAVMFQAHMSVPWSFLVLALFCFLSKKFSLFWSVSSRTKGFGFESVTTVACKQKMLIRWNRLSRMKSFATKR